MILRRLHAGAVTAQSPGGAIYRAGGVGGLSEPTGPLPHGHTTALLATEVQWSNRQTGSQTCADSPSRRATPAVLAGMGGCFWRPCCGLRALEARGVICRPVSGIGIRYSSVFATGSRRMFSNGYFGVVSDEADMEFGVGARRSSMSSLAIRMLATRPAGLLSITAADLGSALVNGVRRWWWLPVAPRVISGSSACPWRASRDLTAAPGCRRAPQSGKLRIIDDTDYEASSRKPEL